MPSEAKTEQTPEKHSQQERGCDRDESSISSPDSIFKEIEAEKVAKLHGRALPGKATTDRELPLYIRYLFQASDVLHNQDWPKHSREFAIHAHNFCNDYAEKEFARDAAGKMQPESICEDETDLLKEDAWLELAAVWAEKAVHRLNEAGLRDDERTKAVQKTLEDYRAGKKLGSPYGRMSNAEDDDVVPDGIPEVQGYGAM